MSETETEKAELPSSLAEEGEERSAQPIDRTAIEAPNGEEGRQHARADRKVAQHTSEPPRQRNAPHPLTPSPPRDRKAIPHSSESPAAERPVGRGGTERTAPRVLWLVAESFLNILYNLFGPPERIAFQHTLTTAPYQLLLSWIRCGEAMMRRLLLIEAASYPKPNTPPLLWPKRARTRKLVGFDDDKPEEWRVSLRCFSCGPPASSRQKRCRQDAGGPKFYSAWPLAERYEALIRVFASPALFARRLAKRLHAFPHRLGEILHAPPEAEHRIDRFEALTHAASARWAASPNTS